MNQKQIEMCNEKITEISKNITEHYKKIQYLEKKVGEDYDEDNYDSYTHYEIDILNMELGVNHHESEIEKSLELIKWFRDLKFKLNY